LRSSSSVSGTSGVDGGTGVSFWDESTSTSNAHVRADGQDEVLFTSGEGSGTHHVLEGTETGLSGDDTRSRQSVVDDLDSSIDHDFIDGNGNWVVDCGTEGETRGSNTFASLGERVASSSWGGWGWLNAFGGITTSWHDKFGGSWDSEVVVVELHDEDGGNADWGLINVQVQSELSNVVILGGSVLGSPPGHKGGGRSNGSEVKDPFGSGNSLSVDGDGFRSLAGGFCGNRQVLEFGEGIWVGGGVVLDEDVACTFSLVHFIFELDWVVIDCVVGSINGKSHLSDNGIVVQSELFGDNIGCSGRNSSFQTAGKTRWETTGRDTTGRETGESVTSNS